MAWFPRETARRHFVSNYGGNRPTKDDKTENSAGSAVAVDDAAYCPSRHGFRN